MAQSSGFDMSKMSTASKILLGGGVLYLIDLFLQWNRLCIEVLGITGGCAGVSGWHGIGFLNGILVLLIVVMEVLILANVNVDVGTPAMRSMIEAGGAAAILVLTLLKVFLIDNEFISWPAWVGIVLAVVIAYGGWMRWQESQVAPPSPPPATGGGGFTS
ncbi:MAG: hypothetical protein HYU54_04065 [Actinobacteria bacterium]|nr:hypothetical protein [Actinomycetota bacterium]